MRRKNRRLKETKVEIIPMIDTMFFLLVFFILSSVGVIKLQGININLPAPADAASTPKTEKPLELTIAIDAANNIFVNKTRIGPNDSVGPVLESEIERQKPGTNKDDVTVLISAHARARYELMVRCIDQARDAGLYKFAIVPVDDEEGGAAAPAPTAPAPPG